jgi:hypothetical protein
MLDSSKMTHEEYQEYMDQLSLRVSKAMEGARLEDAISACAACAGFGLVQLPADQRDKMREHMARIIDKIIEKAPPRKQ